MTSPLQSITQVIALHKASFTQVHLLDLIIVTIARHQTKTLAHIQLSKPARALRILRPKIIEKSAVYRCQMQFVLQQVAEVCVEHIPLRAAFSPRCVAS